MPSFLSCGPIKLPKKLRRRISTSSGQTSRYDDSYVRASTEQSVSNSPTAPPEPNQSIVPTHDTMPKLEVVRYSTLNRSGTLNSTLSNEMHGDKTFWTIGGYKTALYRFENGHELGNQFMEMLNDRAKVEETYAKSLKQWKKRWLDYLNNDCTEYGSSKDTWNAVLDTGEEIANIHSELSQKIIASPVYKIKQWLKEKYQKNFLSFKQKKQFEEEFEEAQKPWLKCYEKMIKAKKEYYAAVKKAKFADQTSRLIEFNPEKNADHKRKAQLDLELAEHDRERAKRKYQDEITQMELLKPRYIDSMIAVFNRTQEVEETRMNLFKEAFLDYHSVLREQIKSSDYDRMLSTFLNKINEINHKEDLNWWYEVYGPGMQPNWPIFEECSNV